MGKRLLLDCTLRDGGYLNDWEFGHNNLVNIFERSVEAGVDIIEIGFIDERRSFDINRSIMPDTESAGRIYGSIDKKNSLVVGMIDYGTCSPEHIEEAKDSFLDGIRVIFKKHLRKPALEYCRQLSEKGYKVFAQLVAVSSYSDEEMADLIGLANEAHPYAVSMVDTYGLMHQSNLMHFFKLLDEGLLEDITLGYHAHNNFQMGYANCIAMLENKISRDIVVDGSLYGMGKSAGNAPIELIAMHMNDKYGKKYKITQFLEAIDSSIMQFYHPATWGYNMFYFIAAYCDCHPSYVKYLMNKQTLSVKSIIEILNKLKGDKKLLYDQELIDSLYVSYQQKDINDGEYIRKLSDALGEKDILFLGPGRSLKEERDRITEYVKNGGRDIYIVSVNDLFYVNSDQLFLTNSKRYLQLATRLSSEKHSIIATSNIVPATEGAFDYTVNYSSLIDTEAVFPDNSLCMFIRLLVRMGKKKVALAGFDGYSVTEPNYYSIEKEYDFAKNKADVLNSYTKKFLSDIKDKIEVEFLTKSHYED